MQVTEDEMAKGNLPAFLQKGGGAKIAKGTEPSGAKSKKLPPFRPGKKGPKPGVPIKKGDKN
jgi:hypothetical protein